MSCPGTDDHDGGAGFQKRNQPKKARGALEEAKTAKNLDHEEDPGSGATGSGGASEVEPTFFRGVGFSRLVIEPIMTLKRRESPCPDFRSPAPAGPSPQGLNSDRVQFSIRGRSRLFMKNPRCCGVWAQFTGETRADEAFRSFADRDHRNERKVLQRIDHESDQETFSG